MSGEARMMLVRNINLKLMSNYSLRLKNVGHAPISNVFDKSQ